MIDRDQLIGLLVSDMQIVSGTEADLADRILALEGGAWLPNGPGWSDDFDGIDDYRFPNEAPFERQVEIVSWWTDGAPKKWWRPAPSLASTEASPRSD